MQEHFKVKNVKCGGCVKSIQEGLQALAGVTAVAVIIDGGAVTVDGDNLNRAQLASKLSALGFPEAT